MKLHTIWELSTEGELTCIDAWDDDSIYLNAQGWAEALEDAKGAHDGEVRVIDIRFAESDIRGAFDVPIVPGRVVDSGDSGSGDA